MDLAERAGRFKFLLRDRDARLTAGFDGAFLGTRVIKTPVRSPRANALPRGSWAHSGASARITS
jgi:hypothetical protein